MAAGDAHSLPGVNCSLGCRGREKFGMTDVELERWIGVCGGPGRRAEDGALAGASSGERTGSSPWDRPSRSNGGGGKDS